MLINKRQNSILDILNIKGSVALQDLRKEFGVSESTIRRDLSYLHSKNLLIKVFGGAIKIKKSLNTIEEKVAFRREQNKKEKITVAKYAASLIEAHDFIYLDAGTTTEYMIPYIKEKTASFVTNAVSHALKLAYNDFDVILIGGSLKNATEAIVGSVAYLNLERYNFTKSFIGVNGINKKNGFTTPDINEAIIKETAILNSKEPYIVCDSSKFYNISPARFGKIDSAYIITEKLPDESYRNCDNIIVVD